MSDPYGSYHPYPAQGGPAGFGQQPTITVDRRPGTVTAAAVVTIVLSALALVGGAVFTAVVASDRDEVRKQLVQNQSVRDKQYSPADIDHILNALTGVSIGAIVLAVIAIVAAIGVLRRSRVARISLTVLSAITLLPAILASFGVVGLPWLAGAIVVIILLYVGGANAWFSRRVRQPSYPTYPHYPGYPPAY